jgi:prepilin-type N-terminal cleavage/methylation domain-containing protein
MKKINKQNSGLIKGTFLGNLISFGQAWWEKIVCKHVFLKLENKWETLRMKGEEFLYEVRSWLCFRVTGYRKRLMLFCELIGERGRVRYYNLVNRVKELYLTKIIFKKEDIQDQKSQKGFTLIELLIAITIFVGFLVVVSNSYISIIRAQKSANETRQMYSEMRNFVDFVNNQMREGTIDYFCYNQHQMQTDANSGELVRCVAAENVLQIEDGNNLRTISKDGLAASTIVFGNNQVKVFKYTKNNNVWVSDTTTVNADLTSYNNGQVFGFSNLDVKNLHFDIYPKTDPSKITAGDLSNQIQPMVLMTAQVASKNSSINFNLNFQTMLTSRSQ